MNLRSRRLWKWVLLPMAAIGLGTLLLWNPIREAADNLQKPLPQPTITVSDESELKTITFKAAWSDEEKKPIDFFFYGPTLQAALDDWKAKNPDWEVVDSRMIRTDYWLVVVRKKPPKK